MLRIVSFVIALSMVTTPALAEELFMNCTTGFLKGLGSKGILYKYSNPWIGAADIYTRYDGEWVEWCDDPDEEKTIKDAAGVCKKTNKNGKVFLTEIDFIEVTHSTRSYVGQMECKCISNPR